MPTSIKSFAYLLFLVACSPIWAQELIEPIATTQLSIVAVGTFQPTRAPSPVFFGTRFIVADREFILANVHVSPGHFDNTNHEKLEVLVADNSDIKTFSAHRLLTSNKHKFAFLTTSRISISTIQLGQSVSVVKSRVTQPYFHYSEEDAVL